MPPETTLLLGAVVVLVVFRVFIWSHLRTLIVNSVIGAVVVGAAAFLLNITIALTPVSILLIVLGGLPGSLLTIVLARFDVAFSGSGVSPETWAVIGQITDSLIGMV